MAPWLLLAALVVVPALPSSPALGQETGGGAGSDGTGDGADDGTGEAPPTAADCLAGTFFDDAAKACVPAPPGTFVAADGATSATPCEPGTYQDEPGQRSCRSIPAGQEGVGGTQDGRASSSIEPCDPGTYRVAGPTTSCVAIPAGSGGIGADRDGLGATGIEVCEPGTFRRAGPTTPCASAPPGSHVPVAGSIAAALCPPGTFSAEPGAAECTPAPAGSYVPLQGSTRAEPCPTATQEGLAVCPEAPGAAPPAPGGQAPPDGSAPPSDGTRCPPGTWSETGDVDASGACTLAAPGTFAAGPGATVAQPCPAGTFSDVEGATACTPAPPGTFVAGVGATEPSPCPGATGTGLTECRVRTAAELGPVGGEGFPMWGWLLALLGALAVTGAGGLGVQRLRSRPRGLHVATAPAPVAPARGGRAAASGDDTGPVPTVGPGPWDGWDEALDGPLEPPQG